MSLDLALSTILSPIVLFFVLGLGAALLRSQMTVPEAFAKGLAIYLMMAIGLKGGVEMSKAALGIDIAILALAALALSFLLPFLEFAGLPTSGHMVAIAALMEVPAIVSALLLARRGLSKSGEIAGSEKGELAREVLLNASVVVLVGSLVIGWVSGEAGMEKIAPFFVTPFQGVLCLLWSSEYKCWRRRFAYHPDSFGILYCGARGHEVGFA